MKKKRLFYLDFIRTIALFIVLVMHFNATITDTFKHISTFTRSMLPGNVTFGELGSSLFLSFPARHSGSRWIGLSVPESSILRGQKRSIRCSTLRSSYVSASDLLKIPPAMRSFRLPLFCTPSSESICSRSRSAYAGAVSPVWGNGSRE